MFAVFFGTHLHTSGRSRLRLSADTLRQWGWLLLAALIMWPLRPAWADLMLAPTRIVFENNQRAAQLDLINSGTETATYRIRLVNRRMSETGEFSAIDNPLQGEQFAHELLRYSPRQVVLAPGAGQVIRLSLRKPANLPVGEYRSHLLFDRLPDAKGANSIESTRISAPGQPIHSASEGIAIRLTALIGASIPVIVRHGETAASVALNGLELLPPVAGQPATLALVLNRSGNRSVHGDLGAVFTPQGGPAQEVGKASGLAVYTPNPLRRVKLALQTPPGLTLARGTLRLTFRERPEVGGKLLAEASIELP